MSESNTKNNFNYSKTSKTLKELDKYIEKTKKLKKYNFLNEKLYFFTTISIIFSIFLLFLYIIKYFDNTFCFLGNYKSFAYIIILSFLVLPVILISIIVCKKIDRYRNWIFIDEFSGPLKEPTNESKGISRLLTKELADLRRLFEAVDYKRISKRHLQANYPEIPPSRFHAFKSDTQQLHGEISISGLKIPLSLFQFFKRHRGKIVGTVSEIEGHRVITAGLIDFNDKKDIETDKKSKPIHWKVNSLSKTCRIDPFYSEKNIEFQVKELAAKIFTDIYDVNLDSDSEAVFEFISGIKAYKDALNQPFRRRQLLHDAEQHFREALSKDDNCIDVYYNLGIVYLELDLPEQALKFLNTALVKKPDEIKVYHALADTIFSPVREKYAAVLRKYWKDDKPFRYLNDKSIYKTYLQDKINDMNMPLQISMKAEKICSAVLDLKSNYNDPVYPELYILRSNISMYLGKEDNFLEDCSKAVISLANNFIKNPDDVITKEDLVEALLNLAMAATRKRTFLNKMLDLQRYDYREIALFCTEIAQKIKPVDSNIYYIRGRVYYYNKEWNKSYNAYNRALQLQPENFYYLGNYTAVSIRLFFKNFTCNFIEDNTNISINSLNLNFKELFSCPSKIRHEVLEHIAEIPLVPNEVLTPIPDTNENISKTKTKVQKINEYIITARIFVIFAHIMDSGDANCDDPSIFENYDHYYQIFKNQSINITDPIFQSISIHNAALKYIGGFFHEKQKEKPDIKKINFLTARIFVIFSSLFNSIDNRHNDFTVYNKYGQYLHKINHLITFIKQLLTKENIKSENKRNIKPDNFNIIAQRNFNYIVNTEEDDKSLIQNINRWTFWFLGQICAKIGREYYKKGNFTKSVSSFACAIQLLKEITPDEINFQRLYTFLGSSLSRIGETNKAIIILDKALYHDSLDSFAHFGKGIVYLKTRNIFEARESFYNALSLSPEPNWRPLYAWYEEKIKIHSWELFIYFGLSSVKFSLLKGKKTDRLKALDDSINALTYFLDIYPSSSDHSEASYNGKNVINALYWLGIAYQLHGEFERAMEQFKFCKIHMDTKNSLLPDYYSGLCLLRLGLFSEAISIFTRIINSKSDTDSLLKADQKLFNTILFENADEFICHCYLYRAYCFAGAISVTEANDDIKNCYNWYGKHFKYSDNRFSIKARLDSEKQAVIGIILFYGGNIEESIKKLTLSITHINRSDLLYHLNTALIYHYFTSKSDNESKLYGYYIATIFKIMEEQCLEINACEIFTKESLEKVLQL